MGCQPSQETQNFSVAQSECTQEEFRLGYRQFVKNDRGQVFQFYHFSKIINRSSTSLIRKVVHRVSKTQRICKIVPIERKQNIHSIKQVQTLKCLDHPNIVQIQEYFFDKTYLYIIMENIPGKRLSQFMTTHSQLSLNVTIKIFQQLLSCINYCHKQNMCHNLVHPENILIIEKNKQFFLKLIDFSEASSIGAPKLSKSGFTKNFINFKSPQKTKVFSKNDDIWSCGMILIFMICGMKNLDMNLEEQKKKNSLKDVLDDFIVEDDLIQKLMSLILPMLNQDPLKRPTIQKCLQNQIFKFMQNKSPNPKQSQKKDIFLSRLMHFKIEDNLRSVFWMYASLNLISSMQKCEYITQFYNLDKNKDGKLDRNQIKEGIQNTFGLSEQEANSYVDKIFSSIDKNNSQFLEYSQYVMATSLISQHISEEQLQKIFRQIDINNDGHISPDELSNIIGGLSAPSHLFQGKRKINLKQFKEIMFQTFDQNKKESNEQRIQLQKSRRDIQTSKNID